MIKTARYECSACGYVYDEEKEGTKFEDLPDDYTCPVCGVVAIGTPITA